MESSTFILESSPSASGSTVEHTYSPAFHRSYDGIYIVDSERRIQEWNDSASRISGFSCPEMRGNRCSEETLVHVDGQGRQLCFIDCPLQKTLTTGEACEIQVHLRDKLGHRVPVAVRTEPVRDADGKIVGAMEIFKQTLGVADQDRIAELERLAYLDKLTGIPNRRYADLRIELLSQAFKSTGFPFAAILIDLDHFKAINDNFGHGAGDILLASIAKSLSNGLRNTDIVARWGGEEFLVLVSSSQANELTATAERCRTLVSTTACQVEGGHINVTASIGAAEIQSSETISCFFDRVDEALYRSKERGRNRVTLATVGQAAAIQKDSRIQTFV
jgi:diguanylate cyclase (GGDEF)-like protein/PAS domain S-box-containing protein